MISAGSVYEFILEEERYRCGVSGCCHQSQSSSDFERHLKEEHGNMKRFICPHCNELIEPNADRNRFCAPTIDITRHMKLHGTEQFFCGQCHSIFTTDFEIQLHLTRRHSTVEFKYKHKRVDAKNGQETFIDEVNVMFECNICHQPIPTPAFAIEHFKMVHPGTCVDCIAVKYVIRSTRNFESVSIPFQRAFVLQQHLICGTCDVKMQTKEGLLAHHRQKHDTRPLAIKFSSLMCFNNFTAISVLELTKMNAQFDRNILYKCPHCPLSNYFANVDDVLTHWSEAHETEDPLPFRFHALPLVSCKYCLNLSPFHDLVRHHQQKHPNQPFVAVNPINQNQCACCNFIGDNLIDHFCREHSTIPQDNYENPVCFNEITINQLLEMNLWKKFKCGRCNAIRETDDDIKDHYLEEHKTHEFDRIKFYDNKSVQLIGGCCQLDVDQITFFEHLTNHEHNFCCPNCIFHTNNSFEFMEHSIEAHEIHIDACTLDLKNISQRYWNSRYVFGNGLVLHKHNLIGTSIDDSQRFKDFAETFVAKQEKNHYMKI